MLIGLTICLYTACIVGSAYTLTPGQLDNLLNSCKYLQLMDALHYQCDPDSEIYIQLHLAISRHLVKNNNFDFLRDTKYFGGIVWWCLTGYLDYCDPISKLFQEFIDLKQHHSVEALLQLCSIVKLKMSSETIEDSIVNSIFNITDNNEKSLAMYNFLKKHYLINTDIQLTALQKLYPTPTM